MSDPASSARFRIGPPSPSSPAGSHKENHHQLVSSDRIPQTPTSPLMSVSAQDYASNFGPAQTSPSQATSQPANSSTPPSSAPMSAQTSQQPVMSTTNSFPTPASSVNATADDPEHVEKSSSTGNQELGTTSAPNVDMASAQQTEHRRTDHDQQPGETAPSGDANPANMTDQPAKDNDAMDVDKDVTSPMHGESSLGSLQKDFTSAFHLCKSCKSSPRSIPVQLPPFHLEIRWLFWD